MTTQEKIEVIRQACIKVNPLKFNNPLRCSHGCMVEDKVTLADVLLAIDKRDLDFGIKLEQFRARDSASGRILLQNSKPFSASWVFWNLYEDDLTQQSEETISFLYELRK